MNSNKTTKVSTEQKTTPFGNVLLPAVISSLGFEIEREDMPITYRHKKHTVRLRTMFSSENKFFFDIPNSTNEDWTILRTVETDEQIKNLFLALWEVSL
jgi:hypothetical protein